MQHGLTMVAAVALLSGCATDAIRIDRATAVGTAGRGAVAATTVLLDEVDTANRDKLIAVAALDPACDLPNPTIALVRRPGTVVCVPAGDTAPGEKLRRFDSRAFAPTLATLEGLSTYLGAIDAILTRKRPDIGAELDGAIVKLTAVLGTIGTVTGAPVPTLPTDEQRQAATGALSLVSGIANEAQTVAELRRFETRERDIAFQETLARLRRANEGLAAILDEELQQQQKTLPFARRGVSDPREFRREEMGLIERRTQVAALKPALDRALDALGQSRDGYLALLRDARAPLTRDEEIKRARLERDRAVAALAAVTRLVKVF